MKKIYSFGVSSFNPLKKKEGLESQSLTRQNDNYKPFFNKNGAIVSLFIALIFSIILPLKGFSQAIPNEAEWNGMGYSLKKVVSNTTIPSGVNFSYTIIFSAPAGATTINITDAIPSSLTVVTVPPPAMVNGVTPVVLTTGVYPSPQTVTYSLTGLPAGMASSGSFTIVVKFPEGTTCNGAAARNRAGIIIDDKPYYTPFVSTSATAADPWRVTKSILSGASVNPSGGSCGYLMEPGDTITYRLSVLKSSPYYGNVVGQQNMSSAVVTDVLPPGAIMLTSTCGIPANSTGTITWQPNAGNLDAATPYAYYYCDITVYYPVASFPIGSFIYNQLDLDGIMCNQPVNHQSNQTCVEVANIVPNPSGYFQKYISLTNRVPGCTGLYTIIFCNNGNVPLTAFNIDDAIPSGVSVDKVGLYSSNPGTIYNITANSGANTIASGASGYFPPATIGYPVSNLQFQMTNSLPVGACIYLYVYFTVQPNPTGTIVTNCATFNGLSNTLSLPQACVSFTVEAGAPHPCILKDVCSPQASYDPGDTVRFRLRVQNIGSANITAGAGIQDILNSNFTYVGNESYYVANTYNPPCSSGGGIPSGTTLWTGVTNSQSGNILNWTLPVIPSDCQSFYVAYCGYYGAWGLPYYFIEFDVIIDSMAMPGVTPNNYTISGGNLTGTSTSNTTYTLVVASFGQEVTKQVSADNGATYSSSAVVSPGDTARYRLNYKNTSNVSVTSVKLVDLLPMDDGANDWLVLNRTAARGSAFGVGYIGNHGTSVSAGPIPTRTLSFASGANICLPPFGISTGCTGTTWGPSPDQNVGVDYGAFFQGTNITWREDFDVKIPLNATLQQTACNDFAALSTANFLLDGTPTSIALTPIAAPPVCVTIDTASATSCCDSVIIERAPGSNGVVGCCARLATKCPVDSVQVSLGNGTISGMNWNCTGVPSGFIGQSNYTFIASGCALDMTTCIDPAVSGITIANFTIFFSNGDTCRKIIDLDCIDDNPTNCCDSVVVRQIVDADGTASCCAEIITKCEVDSITVSLTNGTFSSNTWNCATPIPAAAIGQSSFTFVASNCVVDMTNCFKADQSGIIIVNYTVYFANGEHCDKVLDVDCDSGSSCCDNVKLETVQDPASPENCCVQLVTDCEVDSVTVSIGNGTFASVTWNCAPIPAGYIGQSSYTFNAALCVVDMITCINADSTGIVSVNYTTYFQNGEKCDRSIKLDCVAPKKVCCDSVEVRQFFEPGTVGGCCAEIITKCEVDSITVSLTNGTFSSNTWNCASPIPAAAIGQSSYTFVASNCVVDMVNCFKADQNGIIIVNYTVYFANGEHCDKVLDLDCKADVVCCDSVEVRQVVNADGTVGCCAEIITKCEVDSINISLVNGTFSSNSWNCASPIPVAAIGQSSYTFVASSCVVDMTNCFKADQNGIIIVNYTVYFANGEKCEKILDLDCKADVVCCDSIEVRGIQNPTMNSCCAEIISKCKVDSISVSVLNGTLSSASWNCGSIPAGYVGQSNYTFNAGGCAADLITCVDAKQTGVVTINYVVYMSNGEKCEKTFKLDCTAKTCCDKTKLEKVINSDGTTDCCVKLTTECEVKSINVMVTNGAISSAAWNCGTLPSGYVGQSNYTFNANGCVVAMTNCFTATQSGIVTVTYTINFSNGENCKKTIELDCKAEPKDCCVLVDFKLKQKWPYFSSQIGTFSISNADPSSPICSVTISASPAASFSTAGLVVDGVPSTQSWNSTSIPASGNLSPSAVNSIVFSLVGVKYKGKITVCVVKCDGTKCCFDFKWNGKPYIDIDISTGNNHLPGKVVAVSINPVVETDIDGKVKYVSFGMSDEAEVNSSEAELFAISATEFHGEEYPEFTTAPMEAYMSRFNAFFVLAQPKSARENLGDFNLVFSNKLPILGCTLFDEEGNIIYSGNIDIKDTISTAVIQPGAVKAGMFEFIKLYPNPSDGRFNITYAIGNERDIEIRVVNPLGQTVKIIDRYNETPGIHTVDVPASGVAAGLYKIVLYSEGEMLSKSAILKE